MLQGASLFVAVLCLAAAATTGAPVPFKVLETGVLSGIETRREVVVRTAAEWKALRDEHSAGHAAQPVVDFTTSMVIGVFLGTKPSGGHAVEITGIERDADGLVVTYRERRPAATDMVTQMLTAPFQLVTTARVSGPVRFTQAR